MTDDLPLKLPTLCMNKQHIKRESNTKFLGIFIDENLSRKAHLGCTENKIAKSIGLIYKAKPFLDKKSLLSMYFPYYNSCINYADLVWGSTNKTNLKMTYSQ